MAVSIADGMADDMADDIEELSSIVDAEHQHVKPSVKKWCVENYLNYKKLSRVKSISYQLYRTLQLIVKPYQGIHNIHNIRKDYKQKDRKNKLLHKEREYASIIDVNTVLDDIAPVYVGYNIGDDKYTNTISSVKELQTGGFIRIINKEEEMNKLEPRVERFIDEDDNIMMSLAIGNFVNIAKGKNGTYESCFAKVKKPCKIDMDSFVSDNPKFVMYEEMFMGSVDARYLKLNMVNIIPDNVWEKVKTNYGQFIKFCL